MLCACCGAVAQCSNFIISLKVRKLCIGSPHPHPSLQNLCQLWPQVIVQISLGSGNIKSWERLVAFLVLKMMKRSF